MSLAGTAGGYRGRMTSIHPFTARARAATVAMLLGLGALGGAACSDEDGDGGTTDEEIQDVEDGVEDVKDEVDEEVDAQNEGDNEDGE